MSRTVNPNLMPDLHACLVRLRNGEHYLSCADGWNDGDEILMYGPLFLESARRWYVNSEQIVAYAEGLTDGEKGIAQQNGFRW